ncbi:hypothetical protein DN051_32335 [Streptomyces cadmiisoli]|uniref:Uncharacterized protein n=1 Tax=Streptomyces cadmiisoli TaxID=2184053 RepID=A0A2Z4J7Y7_9ACTN|nr:hypothetical protein DN051_32335 [Streptomyces cadmiisoli]
MGHAVIVSNCANCGNPVTFMAENASRIMAMPILPETGLPVDVQIIKGEDGNPVAAPREYTEEELQRARKNKKPMCLDCANRSVQNMRARGFEAPQVDASAYDIPA